MPYTISEYDITVLLSAAVVFGLPLGLLIPGFSIWNLVPKVQVHRFHIVSMLFDWTQVNAIIIGFVVLFFTLYLEIRKRILDDMVEEVFTVKQVTITTMEAGNDRQIATMKACVELLDASNDHYENLVLLHDALLQRENKQNPPVIELSASEI